MGKKNKSWTGEILSEFSESGIFELGEKIYRNFFHGRLWLGKDRNESDNACQKSFYFFDTYDKASSLLRFGDDPLIVKVHGIKEFKTFCMVVLDAIPDTNFKEWKESMRTKFWEMNGPELCRPAPVLIKFFKQLFGTIERMHSRGVVHCGISELTIYFTSSGNVRLLPAQFHRTQLDLKDCIAIDFGDTLTLVSQLVSTSSQIEELQEFKCFSSLRKLKVPDLEKAQNLSFFLFNCPLSWDSADRHIFFEKIWNLKNMENQKNFKTLFSKWTKADWKQKVMSSNLKKVYERRKDGYEKNPASVVVDLPHNAHNHLRGRKESAVCLDTVDRLLHQTLTEACPAAYFALVNNFFIGQVVLTGPNLIEFFKEVPTFCL